jgi:hypothetical protein
MTQLFIELQDYTKKGVEMQINFKIQGFKDWKTQRLEDYDIKDCKITRLSFLKNNCISVISFCPRPS